ncbi:hypothetical protein DL96DRAFT_521483 [Flagelloscypha sp. PMI_526]|nr:hypothetical protein DL96DRAFT_521483 [Flagelloscypha sp. PMI_526]
MRLASLNPPPLPALLAALTKLDIKTTESLLFEHGSPYEILSILPPGTATLLDLEQLFDQAVDASSAHGASGLQLVKANQVSLSADAVNTVPLLTDLSTYPFPQIVEISGTHALERSVLVLNLAIQYLVDSPTTSALWIDCSGSFHASLAESLAQRTPTAPDVLSRFQVSSAFDLDTLYELVNFIPDNQERQINLIVIDPITAIFSPLLSNISSQGHSMMVDFMRYLRSLMTDCQTAEGRDTLRLALVLNDSVRTPPLPSNSRTGDRSANSTVEAQSQMRPALGPSFAYLSDSAIWITKTRSSIQTAKGSETLKVELTKSKFPEFSTGQSSLEVHLDENGVLQHRVAAEVMTGFTAMDETV